MPITGSKLRLRARWAMFPLKIKKFFSVEVWPGEYIFEVVQNSYENFSRDVFGPGIYCAGQKCVHIQTCVEKSERCDVYPQGQACCHNLDAPSSDRRSTNQKRDGDRPLCFIKKNSRDYEKDKPSH